MSGFKDIAKGGWHPKGKDGKSKESWRGDFRGINQVAGWMGKGKDPNAKEAEDHISRPISTLKDPTAFGPPPKNVNYHGGAALPNQITPDTSGLGAPLLRDQIHANQHAKEEGGRIHAEEAAKPKGPPVPYRKDKTGLSTAHLPPPPGRKDGADGPTPASTLMATKPKPSLPPRLPLRQVSNSAPAPSPPSYTALAAPDAHKGILDQGSLTRLGAAGVSVSGFGIGSKPKSPVPPPAPSSSSPQSHDPSPSFMNSASQANDPQSRFSRFSSSPSLKPEVSNAGTTFAQKQAALKTVSSFRNDPSSVSLSDARAAASTASNFRERHGEQVKSGWQSANKLNNKYGIADKVGSIGREKDVDAAEPANTEFELKDNNLSQDLEVVGKKKPPLPPIKRSNLTSSPVRQTDLPPPLPLSSKPKPSVSE